MRELVRTNDIVLVSAVGALLDGANIHHLVLDQNMSVIEGSAGALPRRIMVHDDDNREARQLLSDAGTGDPVLDNAVFLIGKSKKKRVQQPFAFPYAATLALVMVLLVVGIYLL